MPGHTHTHSRSGHCRDTIMIETWPHSQESTNKTIRQVRLELRLVDWLVRFCKLNGSTLRCDYVTARIISITSHPMSACDHNDHSTTKQITPKNVLPEKTKVPFNEQRAPPIPLQFGHRKKCSPQMTHTQHCTYAKHKMLFFSHQHHHQQNNE